MTETPQLNGTDDIISEFCAKCAEILDVTEVAPESSLHDLGSDSLAAVELIIAIHERWGVELLPEQLFDAATLADVARLIESSRTDA
jgi:acyl carrier protein